MDKKTIKKIREFEYLDIILAILAVFIFYQFLGIALGTSHPIDVVVSESMLPNLKPGDLIICIKDRPKVGDIVIYSGAKNYPIIHRVIGINDSYCRKKIKNSTCYHIKGDNNKISDPPVREEQIMCVVKLQIPYLGYPRYLIYSLIGI
jgi:signal peptidase I